MKRKQRRIASGWHFTIREGQQNSYDVRTVEEVDPEHRTAVALLMAVYPESPEEEADFVKIEGVGEVYNCGELGPSIWIEPSFVKDSEREGTDV